MSDDQLLANRIAVQLAELAGSFGVTDATNALARFRADHGDVVLVGRADQSRRVVPLDGDAIPADGQNEHDPVTRRPRALLVAAVLMVVAVGVVISRQDASNEVVRAAPPSVSADDVAATTGEDWVVTVEGEHVFPHPPEWVVTTDVRCPSGAVVLIAASRDVDPCVATSDVAMAGEALSFIAVTEVTDGLGTTDDGSVGLVIDASAHIRPVLSGGRPWQLVAGGSDHAQQALAGAVAYRYTTTGGLGAEDGPARPPEWSAPGWSDSPAERLSELRSSADHPVMSPAEVPPGWHVRSMEGDERYSVVELGFHPVEYVGIPVDLLVCSSPANNPTCRYDAIDFTHERSYAGATWECGFVRIGVRAPWWCRRPLPDGSWVSFSVASGTVRADHLDQILSTLVDRA